MAQGGKSQEDCCVSCTMSREGWWSAVSSLSLFQSQRSHQQSASSFLPFLKSHFLGSLKHMDDFAQDWEIRENQVRCFHILGTQFSAIMTGVLVIAPTPLKWTNFAKKWGKVESRYTSQSDVRHCMQRKRSPYPPHSVLKVSFIKPSFRYTTQTFSAWFWKVYRGTPFSQICCLGSLRSPLFLSYFTLSIKLIKE